MRRGLHTKLVLILLLLIISLMAVVGAFLMRGVQNFYLDQFYSQMSSVFSSGSLSSSLAEAAGGGDAEARIEDVITAYVGALGVDSHIRNYYLLSRSTGEVLRSSSEDSSVEITANILTAMNGREGYLSDSSKGYMDVALPIGSSYILYILDSKDTVQALSMDLFLIIMEALLIGLVISVLLSFMLSKAMITPIQSLTSAAERVSRGDFSEKIAIQTKDEIGVLTRTFNTMSSRLHDTLNDIENERNKLATLFLHMTDGVVAFSRDGAIMHFNPAAERMLKANLRSGADFASVFGAYASMEELLALKKADCIGFERSIGGMELEISMAPFSSDDAQGGVLALIHDVTQQKRSDELRREFVANVSHELRTPITNIRSYAETLVDTGSTIPAGTQTQFLGVIMNESDRMAKIVQDLLTLSKFDSGADVLHCAPFSFTEAVGSVYRSMSLEAQKHSLSLSLSCPDGLPEVNGDRSRIEQVLLNILSNAVRYTPEGGSVSVSAGCAQGSVWMRVADTGIGIPEADLPRIFDRFYRVDKARSRASGGTGLGLSIANDIVKKHNGRIEVESAPGAGTAMTVFLPVAGPEPEVTP